MKEHVKTAILILLGVSALYLAWRTWVVDSSVLFGSDGGEPEQYAPARPDIGPSAAAPAKCAVIRNGEPAGAQYDGQVQIVYENFKLLLTEALGSASPAAPLDMSALPEIWSGDGCYFEFSGRYPLPLLAAWLSAGYHDDIEICAVGMVFGTNGRTDLILTGADGVIYLAETDAVFTGFPNLPELYPCSFAFDLRPLTSLHPLQLIIEERQPRPAVRRYEPPDPGDAVYTPFLAALDLHPFNTPSYMRGGTLVYLDTETERSCEISPDGTVVFSAPESRARTRGAVLPAGSSGMAADVFAAWEVLNNLEPAMGDATIEVSRVTPSETGFTIEFVLTVGGIPLLSEPPIIAETEGFEVKRLSLKPAPYKTTAEESRQLPVKQAAALAESYGKMFFDLRYSCGGDGLLRADWAVRE
jgi:hypothetical protein